MNDQLLHLSQTMNQRKFTLFASLAESRQSCQLRNFSTNNEDSTKQEAGSAWAATETGSVLCTAS